jgi:aryl-alcohol dehydrogenase-like predicted oxidoreductase
MEYVTLGNTGTKVSRICLGCYSFGTDADWKLDNEETQDYIDQAIDLGINYFDTSNSYSYGDSERFLGNALEGYDRDWYVVASKVYNQMDPENPNSGGNSRKAIQQELDASLERLGLDTIDLYQLHYWDEETPTEETLRTLTDAVRDGSIRYIGGSSMWAYQFSEGLWTSKHLGLEQFVTMQNHYNLAYREEEREMIPLCERHGIGVIPYSPLARGFLARPLEETMSTIRSETDEYMDQRVATYRAAGGEEINERVQEIAADKGVSMAQISLAWLLHKDYVDAPIVGTTSIEHLEDAIEALDVSLSDSDIGYLEEPYSPVEIDSH